VTKEYSLHERPIPSGIYIIRNLSDNRVYVGSSVSARQRLNKHRSTLRRGVHPNQFLQRAFTKYGEEQFLFYHLLDAAPENRLRIEQWWIDYFKSDQEDFGYNLIPTRDSQLHGQALGKTQRAGWAKFSKEERQAKCAHLSDPENRRKSVEASKASRQTPEYRAMRQEVSKRTIATPEMRQYWSDRLKEKWQDPEFRAARLKGLAKGLEKIKARSKAKKLGNEIV
jgi:group I intron endonuclease